MGSDNPKTDPTQEKSMSEALKSALREITDPFKSLAHAPRALWGVYIAYLLEGLVYFGILTILGKYLSENVGLKDLHAGWVYSFFTGGITLSMLFLGGVSDKIGVRRAILFSLGLMLVGRFFLAGSGAFFAGQTGPMLGMVIAGLFFVVIGYGMFQPASYAGVKQFTNEKTSTMGYAMIYGLMNLGAFFSGLISPPIRQKFGIVSVYWFYVLLTGVGIVTVIFILTRKVIQRDTLTRITAEKSADGAAKTGIKQAKLFTPGFAALVAVAVLSVGALGWLLVNRPVNPTSSALQDTVEESKLLGRVIVKLEEEPRTPLLPELTSLSEKLSALAETMKPAGEKGSEAVALAARWSIAYVEFLRDLGRDGSSLSLDEEGLKAEAANLDAGLRSVGILYMAAAYGMVSKVDTQVIRKLQTRMKRVGEDPIPLKDEELARAVDLASMPVPQMLAELSRDTRTLAARIRQVPGGAFLASTLLLEADLNDLTGKAADLDDPNLRGMVNEKLLNTSLYLIRGASPLMADLAKDEKGEKDEQQEAGAEKEKGPFNPLQLSLLGSWLEHRIQLTGSIQDPVAEATGPLLSKAAMNWVTRYGAASAGLLTALVFIVILFLRKRPDHPFNDRKFVFFIFILIPVQTLFAHNWLTLPYYIDRAFGGTTVGDNFEFFSNLNPILIFVLAPMVAAITARTRVYTMMILGTLVMAVPTFLLVLTPSPLFLLTYILLMSIGEAMWQPRFLQWVAEIAPEGKTGLYMGIGQFPWFLTKVITGIYSGYFLSRYCPMVGPQNTEMLWLIHGSIAMVSPVVLFLARNKMATKNG